jgi:threonine aldolase
VSAAAVNLVSDTQSRPTEGMRAAMAAAEVGDEQKLADPTTTALQERVAELLGHEAALFLPSGTMCNLISCKLHVGPAGEEIILAANSHVASFEGGGAGAITHAMTRQIDTPTGMFSGAQVEAAVRPVGDRYSPDSAMVSVEQTTNMGGGRVWPLASVREVLEVARSHGLRAHLDGARLMNAAVAAGDDPAAFAAGFDTAWLDFSKGLGAPVGAVLASSAELIERAWRWKQMFGGSMRQSGVLAAACLHALDHHVERLAEDHSNARALADGLARIPGVSIEPDTVETNIVMFEVQDAVALATALADDGVLVGPLGPRRMRAVTHLDVDAADIDRALDALERALSA